MCVVSYMDRAGTVSCIGVGGAVSDALCSEECRLWEARKKALKEAQRNCY